jgi:hypothetical protein
VSFLHGEMTRELLGAIESLTPLYTIVCAWVSESMIGKSAVEASGNAGAPALLTELQRLVTKVTLSCADACASCGAQDSVDSTVPARSLIDVTVEHVVTVRVVVRTPARASPCDRGGQPVVVVPRSIVRARPQSVYVVMSASAGAFTQLTTFFSHFASPVLSPCDVAAVGAGAVKDARQMFAVTSPMCGLACVSTNYFTK